MNRFHVACTSSTAIVVFIFSSTLPMHSHAVEMDTIARAWREREAQTERLVIKWSESQVNHPFLPNTDFADVVEQEVPELAMYFSGRKLRYESALMNKNTGDPIVRDIIAFNGKEARRLSSSFRGDHPAGVIFSEQRIEFRTRYDAWPLLLLYRGCDDGLVAGALSNMQISNDVIEEALFNNVVLEPKPTKQGVFASARWRIVLNPSLDYAPVEIGQWVGGRRTVEMHIDQHRSAGGLVVPKGWTLTALTGKGVLLQKLQARVISTTVNTPIDDTLFDLPFPVGTLYFDSRDPDKRREYLVLEGNRRREVFPEEWFRGATYEDLLQTESGKAALSKPKK